MIRMAIHRSRATTMFAPTGLLAIGLAAGSANPALGSGTFGKTGSMNVARISHTATPLSNGEVLVAGGCNSSLGGGYLASAELYNPSTGAWTATGSMITARSNFSLTLLPDGEVLAVQGTSAELYNPATGTWGGDRQPDQ